MSKVHMLWVRHVTGRLGNGIRYSKGIVYNNFIWTDLDENAKAKITKTAYDILKARELFPNSSLADMYKSTYMPETLRKSHDKNDLAVLKAYGFVGLDDKEIVNKLFELYAKKVKELEDSSLSN